MMKYSIVVLYEHIVHTSCCECMNKYSIQLGLPVCAITPYSSNFDYNQIALYGLFLFVITGFTNKGR